MVKFTPTLLLTALCSTAMADISMHYYKDFKCSDFNVGFHPTENGCYNYGYSGTHSAGADTWSAGGKLTCTYYSEYDCKGASEVQHQRGCSSALKQYKSVLCKPGV